MRFTDIEDRIEKTQAKMVGELRKSANTSLWLSPHATAWRFAQVWDESLPDAPAPTATETPAEPVNAGDGWRDAVWPVDWGMNAKNEDVDGILSGYDPMSESPWLVVMTNDEGGVAWCKTCQVNDRLPRFVMPGGS